MDCGYHRECYKPFIGLMKNYFNSESKSSKETIEIEKGKEKKSKSNNCIVTVSKVASNSVLYRN